MNEWLSPILSVISALDSLNAPHFIGGSIASIAYGKVRATMDVDIIADLRPDQVAAFVGALQKDFVADLAMILEAIDHHGSFNLIHRETLFKVDVFIPAERPFLRSQFERRRKQAIDAESKFRVYLASPEDLILAKLEWYRLGSEVSDQQWGDVLGILKVQGQRLDDAYLRRWADELNVSDLLNRAFNEVAEEADSSQS